MKSHTGVGTETCWINFIVVLIVISRGMRFSFHQRVQKAVRLTKPRIQSVMEALARGLNSRSVRLTTIFHLLSSLRRLELCFFPHILTWRVYAELYLCYAFIVLRQIHSLCQSEFFRVRCSAFFFKFHYILYQTKSYLGLGERAYSKLQHSG